MPGRRKNAELSRLKRSSRKSKLCDYFSSAYMQYLLIFVIWGVLLLINQSTEMRFEYFWPGWLFICSIHDSLKFQGLQYTLVFIIIVITMDSICFFLFPVSWIYSCGSAYVWIYLLWHTDQGLCFLTLTLCFIFVYFELGFYSRETKFNQSIYLFRPFAAHSIGYPVVCMGFSIKRYLDSRHKKFKKLDVRRRNLLYFRILREAIPYGALLDSSNGASHSVYLPDDVVDNFDWDYNCSISDSGKPLPWSLFLLQQLSKSLYSQLHRWTSCSAFLTRECNNISSHHTCQTLQRHVGTNNNSSPITSNGHLPSICSVLPDGIVRRTVISHSDLSPANSNASGPNNRRCITDNLTDSQVKSKQIGSSKPMSGRFVKEDLTTRLENNVRRLRADVQSMRAVESQLRNQLTQLEREDRLNRLRLSDQRQKNESLAIQVNKLLTQTRSERSSLQNVERSIAEEKQLRQSLESQLATQAPTTKEDKSSANSLLTSATEFVSRDTELSPNDQGSVVPVGHTLAEASSCHRRRVLESEVFSVRLAVKRHEDQLRVLSGARARQANQQKHHAQRSLNLNNKTEAANFEKERPKPRTSECPSVSHSNEDEQALQMQVQHAMLEAERLNNTLRQENWMKQDLLTSYHNSVREINDLNKTHKQRDFQILELTMKIEQLECLAISHGGTVDRNFPIRPKRDLVHSTIYSNGQAPLGDKSEANSLGSLTSLLTSTSNVSWDSTSHMYGSGRFISQSDHHTFHPTFPPTGMANYGTKQSTIQSAVTISPAAFANGPNVQHLTSNNAASNRFVHHTNTDYEPSTHFPFTPDNASSEMIASGPNRSSCLPSRIPTETR